MNGTQPSRLELITKFREKPVREVLQFDGDFGIPQDNAARPDKDGYLVMSGLVWDLRKTDWPVRVQIIPGINKRDTLILLNKVVERIKQIPADDFSLYGDHGIAGVIW